MQTIKEAVEKNRQLILDAEHFIWEHPETGYREAVTSGYMEEAFRALGYDLVCAEGLTGFYTRIETGRPGPEILVLAELDSVICLNHPDADPKTGAVHSCGHHAQCAAMLGIAAALKNPALLEGLSGNIRLCLVPAEEFLEIEYRLQLRKEGKIKYLGGKVEYLSRGYFDGVDIALMVHTSDNAVIESGAVGFLAKNIVYKGMAAHAGGSPWDGCNALYAATCGINAVNAIRETVRERDVIRVHPIITKGGDAVNAIPEEVRLESYIRGTSFEGIIAANRKVNRALVGAALSIGANIEIIDIPGYAPLKNDDEMIALAKTAADAVIPHQNCRMETRIDAGSTDMGDLSCIMPVIHPYCGGAKGSAHGKDYEIGNVEMACIDSAKWQLAMIRLLLENGAQRAKQIVKDYKPMFTDKTAYLAYLDALDCCGDRIVYHSDGTAQVDLK